MNYELQSDYRYEGERRGDGQTGVWERERDWGRLDCSKYGRTVVGTDRR